MTPEYTVLVDKYKELERSHADLLSCLESIRESLKSSSEGSVRMFFSFDMAIKVHSAITNAKRI